MWQFIRETPKKKDNRLDFAIRRYFRRRLQLTQASPPASTEMAHRYVAAAHELHAALPFIIDCCKLAGEDQSQLMCLMQLVDLLLILYNNNGESCCNMTQLNDIADSSAEYS